MPPKKKAGKKLSRRAEAARAAELERQRLEAEEAERLERERQERLEAERRARVAALKKAQADARRRNASAHIYAELSEHRASRLAALQRAKQDEIEYARFVECHHTPNPTSEADVNTFMSIVREVQVHDDSLGTVIERASDAVELASGVALHHAKLRQLDNRPKAAIAAAQLEELFALAREGANRVSSFVLLRSDMFTNERNECAMSFVHPHMTVGLWLNLAKSLRTKAVTYPDLQFRMDFPKTFTHLDIAIRYITMSADPFTLQNASGRFVPVGPVYFVELLALPEAPKTINEWTLRTFTHGDSALVIPYPPAENETPPVIINMTPIRLRLALPKGLAVPAQPKIAWWDKTQSQWSDADVMDVEYSAAEHAVSFVTLHLTAMALVQDRLGSFPIVSWMLYPSADDEAVLNVVTSQMSIDIEIGAGLCRVVSPTTEQFRAVCKPMEPFLMFQELARIGVHLTLDALDQVPGACLKSSILEDRALPDIALCSSVFAIASSKWNKDAGEDRAVFLMREHKEARAPSRATDPWQTVAYDRIDNPLRMPLEETPEERAAAAAEEGADASPAAAAAPGDAAHEAHEPKLFVCTLVQATEEQAEFDGLECADTESTDTLYMTLRKFADTASAQRVVRSSPLFTYTVQSVMRACHLLSIC